MSISLRKMVKEPPRYFIGTIHLYFSSSHLNLFKSQGLVYIPGTLRAFTLTKSEETFSHLNLAARKGDTLPPTPTLPPGTRKEDGPLYNEETNLTIQRNRVMGIGGNQTMDSYKLHSEPGTRTQVR